MGVLPPAQLPRIWRVGPTVPGEWVQDDVRDALRDTSYTLVALAVSLFGFAVAVPANLHVFTVTIGVLELLLAAFWWWYAGYRAARVERLARIERVWNFVKARHLATMSTLIGLAVSLDLLVVALLAPTDGSSRRHLHLLGLHLSISGPQLGTFGVHVFVLVVVAGCLFGVFAVWLTSKKYWQASSSKICEELAKKACTLDDLEQAGVSREYAEQHWLTDAESKGIVVSQSRGTPARKHWVLTKKGAAGLAHGGFTGTIHTIGDRGVDRTARRGTPQDEALTPPTTGPDTRPSAPKPKR